MEFKNKTVLVTGAGGGSGKAIAEAFLKAGAVVIAADLKFHSGMKPPICFILYPWMYLKKLPLIK